MTHFVMLGKEVSSSSFVFRNFTSPGIVKVDISPFTGAEDYISLSLPSFPGDKLDLTQTFIDLTSHPTSDFGVGPTDSIPFGIGEPGASFPGESEFPEVVLYPEPGFSLYPSLTLYPSELLFPYAEGGEGAESDSELRIPIPLLTKIDKTSITGVRFRLAATSVCTFRCLSIRACSSDWVYAPIDLDTLWNRVHYPPSTNGTVSQTSTFPEGWPTVFRANNLPGLSDPMPVNLSVGAAITTGSYGQATGSLKNEFALFFRDIPTDNQTQIEIDTMTQAQLQTHAGQPDFGKALYDSRDQDEIDIYQQSALDENSQFNLERRPDESEHTWLEVKLKWGATTASNKLTIFDADGIGYTFTNFAIEASSASELDHGRIWLVAELQDSFIRVRIYSLNQVGEVTSEVPIFDSGLIEDDNLIKRRKGRFGWWASLLDGDAHIDNVKTRGVNYGEVVSKEFSSITPVKGVSLYAGSTADHELVSGIESTDSNVTLSLDPRASSTGKAIKVVVTPLKPLQGIVTNRFLIDDPNNLDISFNVKFPSFEVPGGGLSALLLGEYDDVYSIHLSFFAHDVWTHVKASLKDKLFQTGAYRLVLMQTLPVVATSWWIENLSANTASVKWSARPHKSDAWDTEGERWQDAGFTLNSLNGGVVFDEIGSGLQVRAQALRQDAMITDFKAIPQYATLGRLVYRDQFKAPIKYNPELKIATETTLRVVTFTASHLKEDIPAPIVAYYWNFGDGCEDSGISVTHTYKGAGTYVVTLTAPNAEGESTSIQETITVS